MAADAASLPPVRAPAGGDRGGGAHRRRALRPGRGGAGVRQPGAAGRAEGGDLDLHVRVPGERPGWPKEDRAANEIERALDDLHVDLLLLGAAEAPQRIDRVAIETGVLL